MYNQISVSTNRGFCNSWLVHFLEKSHLQMDDEWGSTILANVPIYTIHFGVPSFIPYLIMINMPDIHIEVS